MYNFNNLNFLDIFNDDVLNFLYMYYLPFNFPVFMFFVIWLIIYYLVQCVGYVRSIFLDCPLRIKFCEFYCIIYYVLCCLFFFFKIFD